MTKQARTLLLILGMVTLAAAAWIMVNVRNGELEFVLIAPAGS